MIKTLLSIDPGIVNCGITIFKFIEVNDKYISIFEIELFLKTLTDIELLDYIDFLKPDTVIVELQNRNTKTFKYNYLLEGFCYAKKIEFQKKLLNIKKKFNINNYRDRKKKSIELLLSDITSLEKNNRKIITLFNNSSSKLDDLADSYNLGQLYLKNKYKYYELFST